MEFEPVIGFEIHAELKTKSKVFCGCAVDFGAPPNTQVCPVCLGMPGSLPVLNRKAVELVLKTGLAMNCRINECAAFDRKNYYYPDLPKNYQISEQYAILAVDGHTDVPFEDGSFRVRINNIHLEEDAGKNVHAESYGPGGDTDSLVDLNRAGTALMEIVTEPDIRGVEQAEAFMEHMRNLLRYLDVSDCRMQEGSLRFELNVSVKPADSETLNPAYVEMKNLASMRSVVAAAKYEVKRQSKALRAGETVEKETRLWDDEAGVSRTMRSKEAAKDYRYFPDPDLVQVEVSADWLDEIRASIPELQPEKERRYIDEHGLPAYDARVLTQSRAVAEYFEAVVAECGNPKAASNWMMTAVMRALNEEGVEPDRLRMRPGHLGRMIALIDEGAISGNMGKKIVPEMIATGRSPDDIVEEKGLSQITDTSVIESLVDEAIAALPDVAEDVRGGKKKAIGRLVGEVMKRSKGQADPQQVNQLLNDRLS